MSLSSCFAISFLELQARLPGRVRQRLHAAVILIPAAIEHYFFHSLADGALRNHLAHYLGSGDVAAALDGALHFFVERAGGDDRLAGQIVDHLGANMTAGAMD